MNYIANSSGSSMDYADNTASYMETNSIIFYGGVV